MYSLNFEVFNAFTVIRCTRFALIDSKNGKAYICVKNFNVKKSPWETINKENGQKKNE